ncbi:MAG TPA: thiol reductant ABC exporter subunit CydC [Actinomycetales bacterium]|nr:thiol reductant ABC exporter subunit CydC [Actinomycetales bacterium]
MRAIGLLGVRPGRVVLAILAGVGAIGSAIALAAVSAWLIARASQMPPVLHLTVAVVAVRTFGITRGVLRYVERLASHDVALRGMAHLREQLYLRLAADRAERVVGLRRGDVLQRVGADVDDVGDVIVRAVIPIGVAAVLGLGSAALMFYFLPAAGISLLICMILAAIFGPVLTLRAVRRAEVGGAQARADIAARALTALQGAAELQVTGGAQQLHSQLERDEAALTSQLDAAARPAGWSAFVLEAAMGLAVVSAVIFGAPALIMGDLAAVELAVIALTPLAAFEPIQALPGAVTQWYRSRSAAQRIMALLPQDSANGHGHTDDAGRRPKSAEIVVTGLTTGWDEDHPATEGLDFKITPGQAVVLIGPSGAGKTSVLLTIAGLLEPLAGQVRIGQKDPAKLHGVARQETVALNLEDAHIFNTTVLENLRVARGDVSPDEARAALAEVGLTQWLAALPRGLDTMLGADATDVSGGERRRLLIARALVSRARILLIDEPAEHLDAEVADALVADLLSLARPGNGTDARIVVLVTHRHAPLAFADRVIEIRAAQRAVS